MARHFFWILLVLLVLIRQISARPVYNDGDRVRITTRLASEPIRYKNSQGVAIAGLKTYLPKYPEVYYGDRVIIEGVVADGELKDPVLVFSEEGAGLLYKFRKRLVRIYSNSLPEPHASLVAGVTLGSKQSIPPDFWEALKYSGTAHVVVASGMNVTLVAGFLVNLLVLFFSRRRAVLLALMGIWVYALVSGFDAPIIRAAIMGSIGFTGIVLGRVNDAWRGLFLSALVMLVVKPEWVADLGFILSFVATASLMLFEKRVERRFSFLPRVVREDFSTSLSAQIGVAPILWATFGQFNLLSPVINALVLWTIAPITIIGIVGGITALVVPFLGRLILYVVFPMASWFVWIIRFF
ncbi:MAG: ComEC/Rec2 family competence protein, partial [Patescibacteria group bacterium]